MHVRQQWLDMRNSFKIFLQMRKYNERKKRQDENGDLLKWVSGNQVPE